MKRITLKAVGFIAMVFFSLCLMGVACDPSSHNEYYLKNNLDSPITYCQKSLMNGDQNHIQTIQPGESLKIYETTSRGRSAFALGDSFCSDLQLPNAYQYHFVIFADGTEWPWDPTDISTDKHPYLTKCWRIIRSENTKHRSNYKIEYVVNEVDYQNALNQINK